MDGHNSCDPKERPADMSAFVENLLQRMQTRFQKMSNSIITKIDDMGNRITELEQSINDLRAEIGVEGSPSKSSKMRRRKNRIQLESPGVAFCSFYALH